MVWCADRDVVLGLPAEAWGWKFLSVLIKQFCGALRRSPDKYNRPQVFNDQPGWEVPARSSDNTSRHNVVMD